MGIRGVVLKGILGHALEKASVRRCDRGMRENVRKCDEVYRYNRCFPRNHSDKNSGDARPFSHDQGQVDVESHGNEEKTYGEIEKEKERGRERVQQERENSMREYRKKDYSMSEHSKGEIVQ